MKVLIACEYSGVVRDVFSNRGHNAWSCDFLPTERPGNHYQGNVLDIIYDGWDLMIAHPPCTYFAKAGLHYLRKDSTRVKKLLESFEFIKQLWRAPIEKICLENPPGWLTKNWMPPTQTIEPYYFGDSDIKQTSLWLKNLSRLNGLPAVALDKKKFHPKPYKVYPSGKPVYFTGIMSEKSKTNRAYLKAKTFPGIALAMAEQWG